MSALEQCYLEELPVRPLLSVLQATPTYRVGEPLSQRRARRARRRQSRRLAAAWVVLALAALVIAWPGLSLGSATAAGLPTDLASSASVAAGTVYVVQAGDTLSSIATQINPLAPNQARAALVHELKSDVVVPGEHVLIP